jgi:hypothetical protein
VAKDGSTRAPQRREDTANGLESDRRDRTVRRLAPHRKVTAPGRCFPRLVRGSLTLNQSGSWTDGGGEFMSPEELEPKEGISRRRMIKRIGAGAAIAWTAPILTSVRTPAFAATPTCVTGDCACGDPCNVPIPCHDRTDCNCWVHASSRSCTCLFFVQSCGDFGLCPGGADSECGAGLCCVDTCCGFTCTPACGSGRAPKRQGKARTTR